MSLFSSSTARPSLPPRPDASAINIRVRALRRRVVTRLLGTYVAFAVIDALAPSALHHPLIGELTPALLLGALVLGATLWAVLGHRSDVADLDQALSGSGQRTDARHQQRGGRP